MGRSSPLISKTNYFKLSLAERRASVEEELQKMLSVPYGLILTSDKSKNALRGYTNQRWLDTI